MDIIDNKQNIKELKKMVRSRDPQEVFRELKSLAAPTDNFTLQTSYASLYRTLNKEALALKKLRVAILANNISTYWGELLEFYLAQEGFAAEIYQSDYGTLEQTVLNSKSPLYEFKPEITILFTNHRDVKCQVGFGCTENEVAKEVEKAVNEFTALWRAIQKNSSSYIIQNNADVPLTRVWGNYEGSVPWSRTNVLRRFNLELAKTFVGGVTIFDLEYLAAMYGKSKWQDMRFWYHAKQPFAIEALGLVAYEMAKVVASIKGCAKKCIICDLDNTLWGGVMADDGLDEIVLGNGAQGEAFVDFQKYLLALKSRGIMLAVCSKNFEETAQEPFLRHPDMQLKLEDIVAFKANWDNKAENIREIAASLNIGLDSIVYLDDNPAERLLVRQLLPEVSVPNLPEDPADFVPFLSRQSYFETVQFSNEDRQRSEYYSGNVKRDQLKNTFENLDVYLQSLEMECTVSDCDEQHMSRIIQLINKTNQFNVTTIRYTENEIRAKLKNIRTRCRYYKLKDRFGDNGLIAVAILAVADKSLIIDSWLMSCRVLSRGMEEFICKDIISIAKEEGCSRVLGNYLPTKKNKLVVDLYPKLGFSKVKESDGATTWELKLTHDVPKYKEYIKRCEMSLY